MITDDDFEALEPYFSRYFGTYPHLYWLGPKSGEKKTGTVGKTEDNKNNTVSKPRNIADGCDCDVWVVRNSSDVAVAYKVRLVYAPFKKSDIDIQVEDGKLTVKIGKVDDKDRPAEREPNLLYRGMDNTPVKICIPFTEVCEKKGDEIDEKSIRATTDDGVLEILLPVVHKTVSRRVSID